jgi:hypothetical protein
MSTDVEDTPLFDETAGGQAEHLLALIKTRPPTSQELLARHSRRDHLQHEFVGAPDQHPWATH